MDAFTLSLSLSRGGAGKSALQERLDELLSWHTIYHSINPHHPLDVAYLDNHFYYCDILPYFNPKSYQAAFSDKNYYDVIFSHFPTPRTIAKRIKGSYYRPSANTSHTPQSLESTLALLQDYDRVLIKPTEMHATGLGSGIAIVDSRGQDIAQVLAGYTGDIAIQEVITQHHFLRDLQPSSVNTFRIVTFLYQNKCVLLSAVLYIGAGGVASNDGEFYKIGIDENGVARDFIVQGKGKQASSLPSGARVCGMQIPHFDEAVTMAKSMHLVLPHFGLIGWDFTIDENDKPVMIELNLDCPTCESLQFCNAPLFGDLSESVFEEVLRARI